MGKIIDKMPARWSTHHLETTNELIDNQFGFKEGRTIVDAIANLKNKIKQNLKD